MTWITAGKLEDIEQEGAIRFDHGGRTYAIYRGPDDSVYCTAGLCTHEAIHLADGWSLISRSSVRNIRAPSTIAPVKR